MKTPTHVSGKEASRLLLAEIIKDSESFLLLLLAMKFHKGHTGPHFLEGLINKSDLVKERGDPLEH